MKTKIDIKTYEEETVTYILIFISIPI